MSDIPPQMTQEEIEWFNGAHLRKERYNHAMEMKNRGEWKDWMNILDYTLTGKFYDDQTR